MVMIKCANTGMAHREIPKDDKEAKRNSIGSVCPKCGTRLDTHTLAVYPVRGGKSNENKAMPKL